MAPGLLPTTEKVEALSLEYSGGEATGIQSSQRPQHPNNFGDIEDQN